MTGTETASSIVVDVHLSEATWHRALHDGVRAGLTSRPKTLSPVWFYDERGSLLFDEITRLPEYYLTRAEMALLHAHTGEIVERAGAATLVELGSGTSEKTDVLLDAMTATGSLEQYVPLDVSEEMLRAAATRIACERPQLAVHAVVGDFLDDLGRLPRVGRRLTAFLGSTIGNLDPTARGAFLSQLWTASAEGDLLLLGVDLVKDPARLVNAYDDAAGVTATFNRNALRVLNARLGANFEPDLFDHVAVWRASEQWIEMHLRARVEHDVRIEGLGLDVHFDRREDLRTEISAKFTLKGITAELERAGFAVGRTWGTSDYALVLARAAKREADDARR